MKRGLFSLGHFFFLAASSAKANFVAPFQTFGQFADANVRLVWQQLQACGLSRMNAFDPRLPRPVVPANEAVVNRFGRVLAYTFQPGFYDYEFKDINGVMAIP